MTVTIGRRELLAALGGAAAAWPLGARAQQAEPVRRIGVLMGGADDAEGQARVTALKQGLQELGWTEGHNIQIETRFAGADADRMRAHAAELVALAPDVLVGHTTPVIQALRQATSSIPIVMAAVNDAVYTETTQDMIAGQIILMFDQAANSLPHVRVGHHQGLCRYCQHATCLGAGNPDRGRGGVTGILHLCVARTLGTQGHAQECHRHAKCCRRGCARRSGSASTPRGAWARDSAARTTDAGSAQHLSQGRDREMVADHQGREHQSRVNPSMASNVRFWH